MSRSAGTSVSRDKEIVTVYDVQQVVVCIVPAAMMRDLDEIDFQFILF